VCISDHKRGLDWMIGFIASYTFTQVGTTGSYSAIALLHTFQFTITHAPRFSVFTSRILGTDLSQSHCNFKSHKKSLHSLIQFFPLFSTQFNSSVPKLISRQAGVSKFDSPLSATTTILLGRIFCVLLIPRNGPYGKHSLYC
jgi:hypothetical protein